MSAAKREKLTERERVLRRHGKWIVTPDSPAQAEFLEVGFSLDKVIDEVHHAFFPSVTRPAVCFAATRFLAYIQPKPVTVPPAPQIVINAVFNHKGTPVEVIRSVLKHEFIHLVIEPRKIDGKRISHPPEFWEKELEVCPELTFRTSALDYPRISFGAKLRGAVRYRRSSARWLDAVTERQLP